MIDYVKPADLDLNVMKAAAKIAANVTDYGAFPPSGCGRVYVSLSGGTLRKGSKVAKVLEAAGFKLTPRPYCSGVQIYVGYDNCTGTLLAKGEAIAKALSDNGVRAYMDADGD